MEQAWLRRVLILLQVLDLGLVCVSGKQWKKIRDEISGAVKVFNPCNPVNCSCHLTVLQQDLGPFKDGISEDVMVSTVQRGWAPTTRSLEISCIENTTVCSLQGVAEWSTSFWR
ncbi:hypothetical protein Q5P01_005510 [Channa striata]|uniref:Uncharacterized protein n=1 Tax=Channa striata TaxID=64152 RepID=A0AA88NIS9_CHASR|nr:hypothetical protein Q5P01_005510 [Channa striata]